MKLINPWRDEPRVLVWVEEGEPGIDETEGRRAKLKSNKRKDYMYF